MDNQERMKFLLEKPTYACIPRNEMHSVGCSHRQWTKEELQDALDKCKRSRELQIHLMNENL